MTGTIDERELVTPEDLARYFHSEYERLAPTFAYETRKASAVPWEEVPEANRALMEAVATSVLLRFFADRLPADVPVHRYVLKMFLAPVPSPSNGNGAEPDHQVVEAPPHRSGGASPPPGEAQAGDNAGREVCGCEEVGDRVR